jgi:RND family efflux transporter MFP subunit
MKTAKKYSAILVVIVIVALTIVKLFSNKNQLDGDLKALQEYSSVIPVEIVSPKIMQAKQTLEENGILSAGSEVSILSETSGRVLSVTGNVGEHVSVGQTLVSVEKEVLESQYKLAKQTLDAAEKDLNRFNNLIGGEAITQQQLEASKLNYQSALANFANVKKQFENTLIQSPVNGIISKRSVEKGMSLTPSVPVFSILEQNQMIFKVKVAEGNVLQLNKGQKASVLFDGVPGNVFTGNIRSIGVTTDLSGRYEVEVSLAGQESVLRAGMSGKAVFENDLKNSGFVIPRKCIVGSIKDASVFILNADSVSAKKVEAIALNETDVLITQGLSTNDKVVLSGQINLQNGTKVKVINL